MDVTIHLVFAQLKLTKEMVIIKMVGLSDYMVIIVIYLLMEKFTMVIQKSFILIGMKMILLVFYLIQLKNL